MKFTGRLKEPIIDFKTGRLTILFDPYEDFRQCYEELKSCEKLSLEIKKYRAKRSLDANAYAWVLMSKLADVLHTSKEEVYEEMLRHYGTLYEDDEGYITITVKSSIPVDKIQGHWLRIRSNGDYTGYAMIKGSSDYDTAEMSQFIDGIISECKDQGIQIMTPNEIEEMKQKWGVDIG